MDPLADPVSVLINLNVGSWFLHFQNLVQGLQFNGKRGLFISSQGFLGIDI